MNEPLAGLRVLVVEDEFLLAEDLQREAEAAGATVVGPVPSLAQAMELSAEARLDCAILDINLQGEMVFPLADALQARHIPFVFISGYAGREMVPRHAGARLFAKPIDFTAVFRALRQSIPSPPA